MADLSLRFVFSASALLCCSICHVCVCVFVVFTLAPRGTSYQKVATLI